MKQTLCTIRTANFAQMRDFYQHQLRLKTMSPISDDSIWFMDFQTELHIEAVILPEEIGTTGCLRFVASDVVGVANMFLERGVPVKVRDNGSAKEALIYDPDGNAILLADDSAIDA